MNASLGTPEIGDAFGRALLDIVAGTPRSHRHRAGRRSCRPRHPGLSGRARRSRTVGPRARPRPGPGHRRQRGHASLALQDRGHQVVALDVSPGAILACRQRGVREVYAGPVEQAVADGLGGTFDSALLLGNNLGLLASPENAPSFLAAVGHLLRPGGVIVGTGLACTRQASKCIWSSTSTTGAGDGWRDSSRSSCRSQRLATDWFDYLVLSPGELTDLAGSAGWRVTDLWPGPLRSGPRTHIGHSRRAPSVSRHGGVVPGAMAQDRCRLCTFRHRERSRSSQSVYRWYEAFVR